MATLSNYFNAPRNGAFNSARSTQCHHSEFFVKKIKTHPLDNFIRRTFHPSHPHVKIAVPSDVIDRFFVCLHFCLQKKLNNPGCTFNAEQVPTTSTPKHRRNATLHNVDS